MLSAAALAGCTKAETLPEVPGNVLLSVSATIPENLATKSYGDGGTADILYAEAYDNSDLREIRLEEQLAIKDFSGAEQMDAFCKVMQDVEVTSSADIAVILERPLAQLNISSDTPAVYRRKSIRYVSICSIIFTLFGLQIYEIMPNAGGKTAENTILSSPSPICLKTNALQKAANCTPKGGLSAGKMWPFETQKVTSCGSSANMLDEYIGIVQTYPLDLQAHPLPSEALAYPSSQT